MHGDGWRRCRPLWGNGRCGGAWGSLPGTTRPREGFIPVSFPTTAAMGSLLDPQEHPERRREGGSATCARPWGDAHTGGASVRVGAASAGTTARNGGATDGGGGTVGRTGRMGGVAGRGGSPWEQRRPRGRMTNRPKHTTGRNTRSQARATVKSTGAPKNMRSQRFTEAGMPECIPGPREPPWPGTGGGRDARQSGPPFAIRIHRRSTHTSGVRSSGATSSRSAMRRATSASRGSGPCVEGPERLSPCPPPSGPRPRTDD